MTHNRRTFTASLAGAALGLGAGLAPAFVRAQDTSKPLRILVGFPPGGGSDIIARVLADKLKDVLGQPVIVENRAGAGGQIAAQALKAAAPDGNTLFISHDHTISIIPLTLKNPGYESEKDFVPVAGFTTFVNALAVSSNTPARTVAEYVNWVKTQGGGKSAVGVPAPGSVPEFLVGVVGQKYGLDLQPVPYKGGAPLAADMLSNQIPAGISSVPELVENHKAGKWRVIAVMGEKRQAILPDVPTFAELGVPGFEDVPYYGFFGPAGTPPAAIERFSGALAKVIAMPDIRERLSAMALTVELQPQSVFTARVRAYTQTWARIIKASGYQPQ